MTIVANGIDVRIAAPVLAALDSVGRTEDLRFSPDNRLLAIAGFAGSSILLLRVSVDTAGDTPRVTIDDFMELSSPGIHYPHGIDFIDNESLVTANRKGRIAILKIPPGDLGGRRVEVKPSRILRGSIFQMIRTPGSVATKQEANGDVSIYVCNNYVHRVTRHRVDPRAGFRVRKNERIADRGGMNIPDGVSLSNGGEWVAISSHGTNDVQLFASGRKYGQEDPPAAHLSGVLCPHGLRFTLDDRYLLVADAANPVLLVYARGDSWAGNRTPLHSITILDDATYQRGHVNPEEGGPKGIDIDRTGRVLAVTCEEQVLAFHPMSAILQGRAE